MSDDRVVFVRPGSGGWGAGLVLEPTEEKNTVLSVTGGGIHPVAARIAELTGATPVDGFTTSVPDEKVLCAVINCGGTARIGVYPRKRIPTVDVYPGAPGGPLAKYITEDIFVSDVGVAEIESRAGVPVGAPVAGSAGPVAEEPGKLEVTEEPGMRGLFGRISGVFVSFGAVVGSIVNTFLASGRETIELTLKTILPFMAYVSLLLGIVEYTGIARWIAGVISPIASNPLGLVAIAIFVALPFLSPILGPGAAIAQVIGTLMGGQIAIGALPVQYALPTLFAINGQVGCDFVPVGLALGEARPQTVAVGVPAVLLSRLITAPLAVVLAWAFSFGL
ncbi:PTS glucitol/sorbitol transporter subunit IIB [Pseudonocardia eucalypti]|uniref:PTS glucitol/sorbitol transporter subunit IIB n=1 Tax=Pseudonocardia eucalypti TaxID=648755 RepID=A0ABP9RBX5_9PSEU|nr:PTS system glucitol/sorbitol-specific IIC component [Pseudonocardia eucalypti]